MNTSLFERIGGRPKLDLFLKNFYASVRIDPLVGPIFEGVVANWPAHLDKIAGFWSLQTGGPPEYRGGLMARHVPLSLTVEHFAAWLALWEKSCRAHFKETEANEMIGLAQSFRQRMEPALANGSKIHADRCGWPREKPASGEAGCGNEK